jgi:predicted RNA-binding Zn ribbon-like protein
MSVIIVFPDGTDWFKANWVFRKLAQDVSDRYTSDAEVRKAVEVAEALRALDLKKMSDGLRIRVIEALTTVARDTIKGIIAGWRPHDAKEHALYCEAVSELAKCLKHQDNTGASSG